MQYIEHNFIFWHFVCATYIHNNGDATRWWVRFEGVLVHIDSARHAESAGEWQQLRNLPNRPKRSSIEKNRKSRLARRHLIRLAGDGWWRVADASFFTSSPPSRLWWNDGKPRKARRSLLYWLIYSLCFLPFFRIYLCVYMYFHINHPRFYFL